MATEVAAAGPAGGVVAEASSRLGTGAAVTRPDVEPDIVPTAGSGQVLAAVDQSREFTASPPGRPGRCRRVRTSRCPRSPRRDIERLFGVGKVRAASLMTTFGAELVGNQKTLARTKLLQQLKKHRGPGRVPPRGGTPRAPGLRAPEGPADRRDRVI